MKKLIKKTLMVSLMSFLTLGVYSCSNIDDNDTSPTTNPDTQPATEPSTQPITNPDTQPATEPSTQPITEPNPPVDKNEKCDILFVGNSHTYFSSMPETIFKEICISGGYKNVFVTSVTSGGFSYLDHTNANKATYSKIVDELNRKTYEYIVIQERLATPIVSYADYYKGAKQLAEMAKLSNPDIKIVLYTVWGGKESSSNIKLNETGCETAEEITLRLAAAANKLAATLTDEGYHTEAAQAGLVLSKVVANDAEANLFNADCYHPSYDGSYLAAMTIYSTIFNEDPTLVEWSGTSNIQASYKEYVKEVVFNPTDIDAKYNPVV